MNESYLEIVELDSGDIVLRPVALDEDKAEEPLVVLKMSQTTKEYLQDKYFDLAKHMFGAGIDFIYSGNVVESDAFDMEEVETMMQKTIH